MQPDQNSPQPIPRGNLEPPYCWQSKTSVRKIREAFDGDTYLDQALAVYVIHTELASDNASPIYKARLRTISERSGVSLRRVSEIHKRFKQLGLIDWKQNHIDETSELGASTFTLLSSTANTTSRTPCVTPRTANTTSRTPSDRSCKNQNSGFAENKNNNTEELAQNNLSESGERETGAGIELSKIIAYGMPHGIPEEICKQWFERLKVRPIKNWGTGLLHTYRRHLEGRSKAFTA